MKKIILTALVAAATLSITSCNEDPKPIVISPQYVFTGDVVQLMRTGIFELFNYEEHISKQIADEETPDPAITVHTDEVSGDVTGWESNFSNRTNFFTGKVVVSFTGDPLADGSVKTINCSEITLPSSYGSYKLFGSIEVTNMTMTSDSSSATKNVKTTEFGWGISNNDLWIDANYVFNVNYNSAGKISGCNISGFARGKHVGFNNFQQQINDDLGVDAVFKSGSMTMTADSLGYGMFPVDVVFSRGNMSISYNGETENIAIAYFQ